MNMMLSVITVSAFDLSRLGITLESLKETPPGVEHIIVTPSTDFETQNMVADWARAENTNTRILLDGGTGIYGAMNEGIRVALGEYICFWNSGDTSVSPNELQKFLGYLQVEAPAWVISQGVFDWGNFKNQNSETLDRFLKHETEGFISHQTVFVRKVLLESLGNFDVSYKVAADSKLIIQLAQKYKPNFYSEKLVVVETPNFAAANHRTARFEQIRITVECFRGRNEIDRLGNIFLQESKFFAARLKKNFFLFD
jgi:glycosyltransferase involved in cell wall biosynthesis